MIRTSHHRRRRLLAVGACAAVLLMGERRPAAAASAEYREFHQECTEARAAGYSDVGICHVERRLECPVDRDADVPKRSHEARDDDGDDAERSIGP